jgi:hypothetical protein
MDIKCFRIMRRWGLSCSIFASNCQCDRQTRHEPLNVACRPSP